MEPLSERRGPAAGPGSHCAHCRTPARFSPLLASPQTAAQGGGQSREEGPRTVEAGRSVGEGLRGRRRQRLFPTAEEDL